MTNPIDRQIGVTKYYRFKGSNGKEYSMFSMTGVLSPLDFKERRIPYVYPEVPSNYKKFNKHSTAVTNEYWYTEF